MNVHRKTERALYDLLTGSLRGNERSEAESHLSVCPRCARARDRVIETISLARPAGQRPSDILPESYWAGLAGSIERGIRARKRGGYSAFRSAVFSLHLRRPAIRWAIGSAAAALCAAVLFLKFDQAQPDQTLPPEEYRTVQQVPDVEDAPPGLQAWNTYLRRSRVLLTGVSKAPDLNDLSIERIASRELLDETRVLRTLSEDPEADRLLNVVEPLMLKLANASEETAGIDMDLVRTGVRDHNLLFRLRMAEIASAHPAVIPARGR